MNKNLKNKKSLESLSEKDFNILKKSGFLWEFYPDAPSNYKDIIKNKSNEKQLRPL